MSLYNMVCGFNPACVWLLPMLGKKHTEYPRFRDCFLSDDGKELSSIQGLVAETATAVLVKKNYTKTLTL